MTDTTLPEKSETKIMEEQLMTLSIGMVGGILVAAAGACLYHLGSWVISLFH